VQFIGLVFGNIEDEESTMFYLSGDPSAKRVLSLKFFRGILPRDPSADPVVTVSNLLDCLLDKSMYSICTEV